MTTCINLKKTFPQYRITFDPACEDRKDPWMQQIPCAKGMIYPHGGELLAVEVDYHGPTVRKLGRLDCTMAIEHYQCGDNEHTFVFHRDHFEEVAALVGARRRRRVSEATKAKLRERFKSRVSKPRQKASSSL